MAPSPIDLPVLISALPNIQKVANAEQMKPEAARDLFSPYLIKQQNRENREGVQEVDPGRGPEHVRGDEENNDRPRQHMKKRSRKDKEEKNDSPASNASPWTGNILNIKI